jgi:hypothetical protein
MALRLLSQETAGAEDQAGFAAGLQRAFTHVSTNLRRSVGDDGFTALLARALRVTEPKHPVLTSIRHVDEAGIHLDAVAANVDIHGVPVVTAALEALLTSLIDLLGSLIGADMVWSLLTDDGSRPPTYSKKERS